MGSLSSPAKIPSASPPVVYVQQPVYTPPPTASSGAGGTTTPPDSPETTAAKARTEDLLRRSRGIFGTVQTGFRGFLSQAAQNPQKKSLLGE